MYAFKRQIVLQMVNKHKGQRLYFPVKKKFLLIVKSYVTHIFRYSATGIHNELAIDIEFDLNSFVDKAFFVEVFLSLIDNQVRDGRSSGKTKLNNTTQRYRELIGMTESSIISFISFISKFIYSD
ncbi:hypothetical protein BDF21DRAFT_402994 [Thamnidium elegans]|nr:hypothetical protein BDF21DRAFT_402994 [Thamnidium elegans]